MLNMIKSWLLDVELKKGVQVAAQAVAAYLLAHANVLKSLGVTAAIDPNQLQVALLGGIHYLLNILARRFPQAKLLQVVATPHPVDLSSQPQAPKP